MGTIVLYVINVFVIINVQPPKLDPIFPVVTLNYRSSLIPCVCKHILLLHFMDYVWHKFFVNVRVHVWTHVHTLALSIIMSLCHLPCNIISCFYLFDTIMFLLLMLITITVPYHVKANAEISYQKYH